jgi:hypothetical protein
MIELLGVALGGFVVFFIGLAKHSPLRPGQRTAEVLLAIVSVIALVFLALGAVDLVLRPHEPDFGAAARLFALYIGFASGYFSYRIFRRRLEHKARETAPANEPSMSPEYHAANRRMDEIFEALRAESANSRSLSRGGRELESYARMIEESGEALLKEAQRESQVRESQILQTATVITISFVAFFVVYVILVLKNLA